MATARTPSDQSAPATGGWVQPGKGSPLANWFAGRSESPDAIERRFESQEGRSPALTRAYVVVAMVWCFFLCWPTTYVELAGIPLAVAFVAHAWRSPGFFAAAISQPVFVLAALFWAWTAASLSWSADPKLGLTQVGGARWLWLVPALWPALARRRWLIGALAAGFLAGNLSQALHAAGTRFEIPAFVWPRQLGRNSGWWDPVVGGTLLCAALGLHLPAASFGAGRARVLGIAGVAVTLTAIAATGTRGAWIAATVMLLLGALAGVWHARSRVRATVVCVAGLGLVAGAAWLAAGESIARRFSAGREEIGAYFRDGVTTSDTGARIHMAVRAIDAVREHPIRGVGAGGFRAWLGDPASTTPGRGHAHAHDSLLHAAATTGLPGALLLASAVILALRFGRRPQPASDWSPYDAAPYWALLGLVLVSPFDSVQVNAQTCAAFTTVLALCPPALPRVRGWKDRAAESAP